MDEKSGGITDESAQPSPPRWKGAQAISTVHRFNERCIELLCVVASSGPPEVTSPVIEDNRELWICLDLEARRRVAKMPFAILDARFKSSDWWRRAAQFVTDSSLRERLPEDCGSYDANGLPPDAGKILMHETIIFAWQLVGFDQMTAMMSLGMLASVAKIIADLTPKDVRDIATREYSVITIRWADNVQLWRELLVSAVARDDNKLAALHLHAKLRLCSGL